MRSAAHLSDCGSYRYWLSRVWDDSKPSVCFVMLNPSTADASQDDPTIRRCLGFAKLWGGGALHVVNLFALRATNPGDLRRHPDPVGPFNDAAILTITASVPGVGGSAERLAVVAAWGAHGGYRGRDGAVLAKLRDKGIRTHCLGRTAAGQPRHPLYVRADQPLVPFGKE